MHVIDTELLGWWLAERQTPTGGLNGRPEKLPDVTFDCPNDLVTWIWILMACDVWNWMLWTCRGTLILQYLVV